MHTVLRTLRRVAANPVHSAAVIITLAVGIGANTAVFSVVKTVILDPLPYPDAHELLTVTPWPWLPAELIVQITEAGDGFADVAAYYPRPIPAVLGDTPHELRVAEVTPNLLPLLGARPVTGRSFSSDDAASGAAPTALISSGLWHRHFAARADIVGETIHLEGQAHTIVGVLAPNFSQVSPEAENPEVWVPLNLHAARRDGSMGWGIPLFKMAPGSDVDLAQAQLDAAVSRYLDAQIDELRFRERRLEDLKSAMTGDVKAPLLMLQLAVGAVLLIAGVNVANLLLVRVTGMHRELATRRAIGASRGRLVGEALSDALALSVFGAVAGALFAAVFVAVILSIAPPSLPRLDEVGLDLPILALAFVGTVFVGLSAAAIPAFAASKVEPAVVLLAAGRSCGRSRQRHRTAYALISAQIALTLVLLVATSLLARSFLTLADQAPGFEPRDVLAVSIRLAEDRYESALSIEQFASAVITRIRSIPGVRHVAVSNRPPLARGRTTREYTPEGEHEPRIAEHGVVSAGYFDTLQIPVLSGRDFDARDRRDNELVVIIDAAMQARDWPETNPVGSRILYQEQWRTIIGVAGSIRGRGLARPPAPGFYIPYQQRASIRTEVAVGRDLTFLMKVQPGLDTIPALRAAIAEADPYQPIAAVMKLEDLLAADLQPHGFRTYLLASFAAIALMLAASGLYGLVSFLVTERRHEFGVRMAVGATGAAVQRMVVGWGFRLCSLGVVLGLFGSLALNRLLGAFLFEISAYDAGALIISSLVLFVVALVACAVPAWQAARFDLSRILQGDH